MTDTALSPTHPHPRVPQGSHGALFASTELIGHFMAATVTMSELILDRAMSWVAVTVRQRFDDIDLVIINGILCFPTHRDFIFL